MTTNAHCPAQDHHRALFSRAASLLSESRTHREALERTLEACLPALGDFGFFDARQGDAVVRIARAHQNGELEALLRPTRWARNERADLNLCALSSGKAALHSGIEDSWYRDVASGPEHLAMLRRLAFRSMITVPMLHQGQLIGSLTLFMAGSGRQHSEADLALASDLAGFGAPVVANAALLDRHEAALAALRTSEERLRMSVHAAGVGIWEWSIADNEVYWSAEYREIYGIASDEKESFQRGISPVVPEDLAKIEEGLKRALAGHGEFSVLHRIRHPVHGIRWLHSIGRPIRDAAGVPVRLTGVVMDVTERNRRENELHELREQLSEELQAMHRLHQISSRHIQREERLEDLLMEILQAALEITGRERGAIQLVDSRREALRVAAHRGFVPGFFDRLELVGRDSPMPSALAWRTGHRIAIPDIRHDPRMSNTAALRLLLDQGILSVQSTPLVSRGGEVLGMFTTHGTDVHRWTPRELRLVDLLAREAADFIERAQSENLLKEADRRKDEFLAILAHELRNPLAPIRYAISIARAPGASDTQRAGAQDIIDRQVSHMGRLLDDLLDVSRIARGVVELKRTRSPLANPLLAAVEACRPLLDSKGHILTLRLPEHAPLIDADPVRVTQIVTNLLSNATKYTPAGGAIQLEALVEDRDLAILLTDNGVGIPAELRPRLFTLFTQAEGSIGRADGGLGIGLALVKGFVELHGGTVEALGAPDGRGTRFVVRLPGVVVPEGASGAADAALTA